jgi:transposase
MLVLAYHVLQTRTPYQDLGGEYFEHRNVDKQRKRLIRPLESLGVKVTVAEIREAAYPHRQYFHSRKRAPDF